MKNDYELPMRIMQKCADKYNEEIISIIDADFKVCVYINNIDKIKHRKYLFNLEGRGLTYRDACIDYIKKLMDKQFNIRYKRKFYATEPLRNIVKRTNFNKIY